MVASLVDRYPSLVHSWFPVVHFMNFGLDDLESLEVSSGTAWTVGPVGIVGEVSETSEGMPAVSCTCLLELRNLGTEVPPVPRNARHDVEAL